MTRPAIAAEFISRRHRSVAGGRLLLLLLLPGSLREWGAAGD